MLIRSKNGILQRSARFFGTLLNTKSLMLNPDLVEHVTQRPTTEATRRLGAAPDFEEVKRATNGLQNRNAGGHNSLPAELPKVEDDEPIFLEGLHAILDRVWNGDRVPQECKDATIKVLCKKGDRSS